MALSGVRNVRQGHQELVLETTASRSLSSSAPRSSPPLDALHAVERVDEHAGSSSVVLRARNE
jgi:hypothetical protein